MTASSSPGCVLAATSTGRSPDRAAHFRERALVRRRRRHVELQIAADDDAVRAKRAKPVGVGRGLRQKQIGVADDRARQRRHRAPRAKRALRHAGIDDGERQRAPPDHAEHRRPELRFGKEREARPPIVEKAADGPRRVDRHELVDGAGRQPPLGHLRRGDRAGRQEKRRAERHQAIDQRQRRGRFTDACRMHPDERAGRARKAGDAEPLAAAAAILLAAPLPPLEQRTRDGSRQMAGGAIDRQRGLAEEPAGIPVGRDFSLRRRRAAARRREAAS